MSIFKTIKTNPVRMFSRVAACGAHLASRSLFRIKQPKKKTLVPGLESHKGDVVKNKCTPNVINQCIQSTTVLQSQCSE